jgi:hypothetical protein
VVPPAATTGRRASTTTTTSSGSSDVADGSVSAGRAVNCWYDRTMYISCYITH